MGAGQPRRTSRALPGQRLEHSPRCSCIGITAGDSAGSEQDVILDFAPAEDRIDLAGLLGALDLAWGGTTATPNGVWTGAINGNTLVYADLSGDTTADFRIQVNGLHALTPAQFSDAFTGFVDQLHHWADELNAAAPAKRPEMGHFA